MDQLFYVLLLVGCAASLGLAAVTGWLHIMMFRLEGGRQHIAHTITKTGIVLTNGILINALARTAATTHETVQGWAFIVGLAVMTVGLAGQSRFDIIKYALMETLHHDGPDTPVSAVLARIQSDHDKLAARMSAEEKLSTDNPEYHQP